MMTLVTKLAVVVRPVAGCEVQPARVPDYRIAPNLDSAKQ